MADRISKILNNVQNRSTEAWLKLCEYIDRVEIERKEECRPLEYLGSDLYSQIYTLSETIS